MKSSNTLGMVNIADIRHGDIFWESESGQDACFVAITAAKRGGQGITVQARELATGKPQRFFEHDRAGGYGPRLYIEPQYTRPNPLPLLDGLATILREEAEEERKQAAAREEGLSLAATQYSESRDAWMTKAKARQEEINALKEVIAEMMDIASQNLNGITMGARIREALYRSVFAARGQEA